MPDTPQPPQPGWKYWVNNFLSLGMALVLYIMLQDEKKLRREADTKLNEHLQNDAQAQASMLIRSLERQSATPGNSVGYGSLADSSRDTTNKRAGQYD